MQEQSLMVHGQKTPSGFAAAARGDQALPQLRARKGRARLLLQQGQTAAKGACVEEQSHAR